ncbi:MAG: hypothetical protein DHS20C18_49570 [Saprospiraceae bacterium]|nr:MAG: hypothetical protein DHS20C18_49570 [Saprospiraceae bacterium]
MVLQKRTLQQLLKRAENTAFGKHYQFDRLQLSSRLVADFQNTVPVHDYDQMFDNWWSRTLAGEADVCWKGRTKYFALSSGTSGANSKYIPVTYDMTRSMRSAGLRMFACLPQYDVPASLFLKDWLMVGGSAHLKEMGPCYVGDLSGINARKPPIWIKKFYKPGTQIAKISNWDERLKTIAEQAYKWDVGVLTGIPAWVQLTLEYIVDHYKLNHIHELWPNLKIFVSGGTAFQPYRKSFEALMDQPLIIQDSYLASEGFIAFQDRPETNAMRLLFNNGLFFEFVPFNEQNFDSNGEIKPQAEVLTIDRVREGVDYVLLLSSCAGAWRYLIGDTIKFTDLSRSEIIITGRTKHFLSICGEHLSVDNMNAAMIKTKEKLKLIVREFTVSGIESGSHHAHRWYIGCDQAVDPKVFANALDQYLMEVNADYASERDAMLGAPEVHVIPTNLFYDWQRRNGKMNGQSKIARVMNSEQFAAWEKFIGRHRIVL